MKKLGVVAALCLLFSQPAFAMVPLTPNAVQSAQAYGVERKGASLSEVLAPWTVYDRKQMNPLWPAGTGGGLYSVSDRRGGCPQHRQ